MGHTKWSEIKRQKGVRDAGSDGMSTWIRRRGVVDSWHLKCDPPANAPQRGLAAAAACGTTFTAPEDFEAWSGEEAPAERDRCPACQAASTSIGGPLQGTISTGENQGYQDNVRKR